jgi:hypothetical protein
MTGESTSKPRGGGGQRRLSRDRRGSKEDEMGPKIGRAVGVALLVAAVGGAPAWGAGGGAGPGAVGLLEEARAWWSGLLVAWGLAPAGGLAAAWAKEGHDIDPNGVKLDAGHDIDPNGTALATASGSEPTDAGHQIDPNG